MEPRDAVPCEDPAATTPSTAGGPAHTFHSGPSGGLDGLPDPPYPRRTCNRPTTLQAYRTFNRQRAVKSWLVPYAKSHVLPGDFHPLLSYLFTEYKCNLDCHYCWAYDNRVKGMTEAVARSSIDWLHDTGCRALAIMGGEPLLRPKFMHKVIDYAARRDFFCYLPTNGRLMKPDVIDRLGDAGVATFNLAVDVVDERPGLPKALAPIRPQFEYLVRRQHTYGYTVFLNINITRLNMGDVRELTEIAREHDVATDYHINEAPMQEQAHFRHLDENDTYLRPEDFPKVDDLLDHLTERNRQGYKMINSVQHLQDMKAFLRGRVEPWTCRAGQNSLIIRTDGTLAPCFTYYSDAHDWGAVGHPKFERRDLDHRKAECHKHCLSTCQHTLGYAYSVRNTVRWLTRQARNGFRGVTGSY